jgi:hypothetical protein
MPSIESMPSKMEVPSPLENLNNQFISHNNQLEELISRLRMKLHKLSDTNVPLEQNVNKCTDENLPFRDGHLMQYYHALNRNGSLLGSLTDEVIKLESLI